MASKSDQIRALREANADRWFTKDFKPVKGYEKAEYLLVDESVINAIEGVINTNAQRQAKWRKANTELNRQRAKEGMRKRRAQSKDHAA